jgi:hypothetical protein
MNRNRHFKAGSHPARLFPAILGCGLVWLSGCGGGGSASPSGAGSGGDTAALPTASIHPNKEITEPVDVTPAPNSPEAMIAEITRLRTLPDTVVEVRYENGQKSAERQRLPTAEEIAAEQKRRQERIVELAGAVIKKVHDDKSREQLFNNAVHYFGDARMQLALLGDAEQAQLLSDDANSLYDRDKSSFAAIDSGFKVVELAEAMAARHGPENREWVKAYANQARLFADRFPQEQGRVAVSLIAAGRKCEQFGLHDDARQCYFLVERLYTDSPFTQQIAGILRRLRLVGQPLELAGSTIDGGFLSADQFAGKPMLVAFWASNSETFRRDIPVLKQLTGRFGEDRLTVIGVNMDQDEYAVDAFLEQTGIGWRQIFFSDAEKRGGKNPVARFYGVHAVPTYWIVDARGVVVAAPVPAAELESRIATLLAP